MSGETYAVQGERYLDETIAVLEHLGEDRLDALHTAWATGLPPDTPLDAGRLINGMVVRHTENGGEAMDEIGHATVADALSELTSKNAIKAVRKGKMTISKAVDAHEQRAAQAASELDMQTLREPGIAGTTAIYVDETTGLHLVQLMTVSHCVYEGVYLGHSMADATNAAAYLGRALLYSLREKGTEPRVTLEVDERQAAVIQARSKNNQPVYADSPECQALRRALGPLAAHLSVPQLVITDKIAQR